MKQEIILGTYETPDVSVMNIGCEGIFCSSNEYDTADYGYDINEMFEI